MNDELGLRVGAYEWALDRSRNVEVALDQEPFDPGAELARAERIATLDRYSARAYRSDFGWHFAEPVFSAIPSPQRAQWWAAYLEEREPHNPSLLQATLHPRWGIGAWLRDLTAPGQLRRGTTAEHLPARRSRSSAGCAR